MILANEPVHCGACAQRQLKERPIPAVVVRDFTLAIASNAASTGPVVVSSSSHCHFVSFSSGSSRSTASFPMLFVVWLLKLRLIYSVSLLNQSAPQSLLGIAQHSPGEPNANQFHSIDQLSLFVAATHLHRKTNQRNGRVNTSDTKIKFTQRSIAPFVRRE